MSKKFGKFVLVATAVATAAAAAYYFSQKKKETVIGDDEDFDDFSEDAGEETSTKERSYVELNMDGTPSENSDSDSEAANSKKDSGDDMLAKAASTISNITNKIGETAGRVVGRTIEKVEEFFDDDEDEETAEADAADETDSETDANDATEADGASSDAASSDDETQALSEDSENDADGTKKE